MPNEQSGKSTLGALCLQYLGGDDDWYSGTSDTISSPITISGAFASILKFANENSLSIVPEAQNMTKYDGSGIATVTLSTERMDINAGGGGTPEYQNGSLYVSVASGYQFNVKADVPFIENGELSAWSNTASGGGSIQGSVLIGGLVTFTTAEGGAELTPTNVEGLELVFGSSYKVTSNSPSAYFRPSA